MVPGLQQGTREYTMRKGQKMVLGKLDSHIQKIKLDHYLTPCIKVNSKFIDELNVRPDTIKLLEENMGVRFLTLVLSMIFVLNLTPKAKSTKAK